MRTSSMTRRRLPALCAGVLLVGVFCAQMCAVYTLNPYACEDAYITFRFSRNLAEGAGPVFNAGDRVEGYSNFLWMAILAAAHAAGIDMQRAGRFLGGCFHALSLLLVWYIPRRRFGLRGGISMMAPLLYALFLPLHFYAASGLETSMYTFLILLCLYVVSDDEARMLQLTMAGFVFLLIALTRPEGVLFFVFYAAYVLWQAVFRQRPLQPAMPGIMLCAAGCCAFLAWRLSYYGLVFPNTYYAKGMFPLWIRVLLGVLMAKGLLTHYPSFLLLLVLACFAKPARGRALTCLLLFLGAGLFFSVGFSGFDWLPFFRYTLPVVPVGIILCQAGLSSFWEQVSARRRLSSLLVRGIVIAGLLVVAGEQFAQDAAFNVRWKGINDFAWHNQKMFGDWLRTGARDDAVIAMGDVGRLAFFSEADIVDIYGLASRRFADIKHRYGSPDIDAASLGINFDSYKKKELDLLLAMAPDYVLLYNAGLKVSATYPGSAAGITEEPRFLQRYEYLDSLSIIPGIDSPSWPRLAYAVDVTDLAAGLLAWINTGWGYDIYIRRDSPCRRFSIEADTGGLIRRIIAR